MRKDYYQMIDSYIDMLWDDKKRSYDQLDEYDIDSLTSWLIKAEDTKFLPSLDILDAEKDLLFTLADWINSRDHDLAIDIMDSLRFKLGNHYKKRITNLLDQKEIDESKKEYTERMDQYERDDMYNADYSERLRGAR